MEGPPLGPGGEDITWPNQVAPRGRKASSTGEIKPQTSNLLWATAPGGTLLDQVCYNGAGVGEVLDMAAVEVAGPNEIAYIVESFLGVFMLYLSIHQGFGLRGRGGPSPIANIKPQVLHGLLHELTLLQLESGVVLLADRKELT